MGCNEWEANGRFRDLVSVLMIVYSLFKPIDRHGMAAQVNGFPGGCQAGYRSLAEANAAWEHVLTSHMVGPPPKPSRKAPPPSHADMFPRPPPVALPVKTPPSVARFKKDPAPSSPHVRFTKQQPTPTYTLAASPTSSSTLLPAPVLCQSQTSAPSPPVVSQSLQPVGGTYYRTRPVPSDRLLGLDEEEAFWVVVEGWRPGVYQGK